MKPVRTWIAIVDSRRFRVLENLGPGKGATPVDGMDREVDLQATSDIVSDRQGRSFESANQARHALEPRSDPNELQKEAFLKGVAEAIAERHRHGAFDRLVLAAPPWALGRLRTMLPEAVKASVSGEVAKDLTKIPDHDIAAHLAGVVRL